MKAAFHLHECGLDADGQTFRSSGPAGELFDEIGAGRRLFDVLPRRIELDIVRVVDTPEATHIRYRVRR